MILKDIAIIGAGTMGHGLAIVFAQQGCRVRLHDISVESLKEAKKLIAGKIDTLSTAGMMNKKDSNSQIANRITYTSDLTEAVTGADFVVEAIFENVQAKRELFSQLDKRASPSTIIASNTSFLNIYEFVEVKHPERLIITHWFEPPYIVPLVEIVPGPQTSTMIVEDVVKLHNDLNKETIVLDKFLPGFIGNRLQAALAREVFHLLDNGYATPENIDKAAKASFGLRLPILGLVQRMDFTGLDMMRRSMKNKTYRPPKLRDRSDFLDALIAKDRMGVKSGKGFYDYQGRPVDDIFRDRDIKLLKLKAFLNHLE